MKKILLITFDISPYRGSEASVSWNYVTNMNQYYMLYVIYAKGEEEIKDYCETNKIENVSFICIPNKMPFGNGVLRLVSNYFNFKRWHHDVYKYAKIFCKSHEIDIIHYLNPIGFKEPGFCWKIDVPYVWGPMKGVDNRPFPLYPALSYQGKINALTRRFFHNIALRCSYRVCCAIKRADVIFSAVPNTVKQLNRIHNCESIYLPENGIMKMYTNSPIYYDGIEPLRLIWIGAIVETKGLTILLDALKCLKPVNWHLDVIGAGRQEAKCKQIAKSYSILNRITWHGQIKRNQVFEILRHSHLHIITSLGEGNPTIIWEAMSFGVPTMTLDHCGMSAVICEKCGIKIKIHSYRQVVQDIAQNINEIIERPSLIEKFSLGVLECSKKFMWASRLGLYRNVYDKVIDKYSHTRECMGNNVKKL